MSFKRKLQRGQKIDPGQLYAFEPGADKHKGFYLEESEHVEVPSSCGHASRLVRGGIWIGAEPTLMFVCDREPGNVSRVVVMRPNDNDADGFKYTLGIWIERRADGNGYRVEDEGRAAYDALSEADRAQMWRCVEVIADSPRFTKRTEARAN